MQKMGTNNYTGRGSAQERQNIAEKQRIQSETVDWLRFPLVIFVVFIHNFGLPVTVNLTEIDYSAISGMDIYNVIGAIVRELTYICNPCFFLFSGYFFFANIGRFDQNVYFKKIKTRVKTLLVPYILWNLISIFRQFASICVGRIVKKDGDWGQIPAFFNELMEKGIGSIFWNYCKWDGYADILGRVSPSVGPFHLVLWFLQTLIILAILSPVIYLICKYLKRYGILLLGILYYTGIWVAIPGFGIMPVFFFALGAYCGIYKKNMVDEARRWETFWYAVSLLTLLPAVGYRYNGVVDFNYFSPLFMLAAVISSINIASRLIESKKVKVNKTLSQSTFFIYLLHTIWVLSAVRFVLNKVLGYDSPVLLTIQYLAVPILTAYVCAIIYYVMKKIMPRVLNILSGNR